MEVLLDTITTLGHVLNVHAKVFVPSYKINVVDKMCLPFEPISSKIFDTILCAPEVFPVNRPSNIVMSVSSVSSLSAYAPVFTSLDRESVLISPLATILV